MPGGQPDLLGGDGLDRFNALELYLLGVRSKADMYGNATALDTVPIRSPSDGPGPDTPPTYTKTTPEASSPASNAGRKFELLGTTAALLAALLSVVMFSSG